ncbi:MAG: hypothetical protein HC878_04020 [Leptolyngbyaceae cyanobacterium SL_5_14]|nr:hypothetical protein [Leptolyngbyaceae cyanobacterium SL_5_14]
MAIESMTERSADGLTDAQWDIAHAIAQSLVKDSTDVNEFGKAIAYLRSILHESDAGDRFFKYLKTLVTHGRQVSHSGRTLDYYRSIEKACSPLKSHNYNAQTLIHILSWSSRLVRYYKVSPIGEQTESSSSKATISTAESERQREIKVAVKAQSIEVGQILEATVTTIKGSKVTYEIFGTIRLTQKEPKNAELFTINQSVRVKVVEIKDDGSIKKIQYVIE